jgi:hypothetical protein
MLACLQVSKKSEKKEKSRSKKEEERRGQMLFHENPDLT